MKLRQLSSATASLLVLPVEAGCVAQGPSVPVGDSEDESDATYLRSLDIVSDEPLTHRQLESLAGIAENIKDDPPRATVERQVSLDETVALTNECMSDLSWLPSPDLAVA